MKQHRTTLQELIRQGQVFAPCIWDCRTAKAAKMTGFQAALLSGGELAESVCGVPDIGLISADDLVQATERICQFSDLPIIIDADDGFGETPLTTYRLTERLIRAGAAGATIDDTTGIRGWNRWGNRFSAAPGAIDSTHDVVSRDVWLSKIKAALAAAEGTDFLVIARTECLMKLGIDEAIERCLLARELGAPMTLVLGIKTLDDAKKVAARVPGWKMWPDVKTKNGVPDVSLDDIAELGFCFVTVHYMEKACMYGLHDFGQHVIQERNLVYVDQHTMDLPDDRSRKEWVEMGLDWWLDREAEFQRFPWNTTSDSTKGSSD